MFAAYLTDRAREFNYEAPLGTANPDFRVSTQTGDVICEVVEPEANWGPSPKQPLQIGSMNPYDHIRNLIGRKKRQGLGAKGQLPYVLIIRPSGGIDPFDPLVVVGAMLGDIAFSVPTSPDGDQSRPTEIMVTSGARMQPNQNTRFAALAVLRKVNPTRRVLDFAVHDRLRGLDDPEQAVKIARELTDKLIAEGLYRPAEELPRVDVCHNPFASVPLALTFFDGPFDRQWADPGDNAMQLVTEGIGAAVLDEP